jgi:GTPase SAR1 family protein
LVGEGAAGKTSVVNRLVLDGRKDERPEHWLKQILSVSGEAKILVVDLPMRRIELAENWFKVKKQLESWRTIKQAVSQQVTISIEIKSLSGKLDNWAEDLIGDLPEGEDNKVAAHFGFPVVPAILL